MARAVLLGGFYVARSLIAEAQRSVNLVGEANPEDAPVPVTHYPRAGLITKISAATGPCRAIYRASTGAVFECVGDAIYSTSSDFVRTFLGEIAPGFTLVGMADNGIVLVIVDGSTRGWTVNLSTMKLTEIADEAFYGSIAVSYTQTVFVFTRPGTQQYYLSPPDWDGVEAFDPLDFAAKVGGADPIANAIVMKGDIWEVGTLTTEVSYNAQGADFLFAPVQGVFIEHGCVAPYSLAKADLSVFWLSQDVQGQGIVIEGKDYNAGRISTHAIEYAIGSYAVISDAIGFTFQEEGHTFYQLTFPTADKTWVYDLATKLWHERTWTDENGIEHRHRANTAANAYGLNVCGDWETGVLYQQSLDSYTDFGGPIVYRRGFPHMVENGNRVSYTQFIADMAVGNGPDQLTSQAPLAYLRWSDTRGASWGNPVQMSLGSTGNYLIQPVVRRLGMARDRVFEVFWSAPVKCAIQGAWVDTISAGT